MWLQYEGTLGLVAPTTDKSLSRLHEINRSLVLRAPDSFNYVMPALVDLDEGSRHQEGIHREILHPDVSVREVSGQELRKVAKRDQSPLLDHAAKVHGLASIEPGIKRKRHLYQR